MDDLIAYTATPTAMTSLFGMILLLLCCRNEKGYGGCCCLSFEGRPPTKAMRLVIFRIPPFLPTRSTVIEIFPLNFEQ